MRTERIVSVSVALLALCVFFGCAGKKDVTVAPPVSDRPEWVDKGGGAFAGEIGRAFYGVGIGYGSRNPAMNRMMAGNRARSEIAKIFNTYTATLMKDYVASTMAGDPDVTSEEQHVEQTIKTFAKAELAGVQIVDHYSDSDGTIYALARMELNTFENFMKQAQELSQAVRQRVVQNAERAFDELAREEAMQR